MDLPIRPRRCNKHLPRIRLAAHTSRSDAQLRQSAPDILRQAAQTIDDRAAERDQEQERSMGRAVAAFNALTGHQMSERDGWLFMATLKIARATNTPTGNPDDYIDLAAYGALAGESVA
ncbi:MAG: hypothetical protein GAK28_03184 [Luteibacter sp.]|uniref:DUF6378 domain-containing protein n=1 Tax=Luteibacter sp. TaxID=1886636 RepID=UPI00138587DB|nr:DUF6378 domain-containing protein [Luteibacter sp.]KAF1005432.1 MAG: hypothetical protein GAK28_03184 [Luteibacter sp.]